MVVKMADMERTEDFFIEEELGLSGFEPEFIRPPPSFYEDDDDAFWVHPEVFHDLFWDETMCPDVAGDLEFKRMLQHAMDGPLTPVQRDQLRRYLVQDGVKLVQQCGLSPQTLPGLVEHNPHIAIEVLLLLMTSSHISRYLQALIDMEVSLQSMEVVNKLASLVALPTEFIHLYISNCMSGCRRINDTFLQARLVRIACAFFHSLVRNNVINIDNLQAEIQSFCIEFSNVKEANVLFRLLRQRGQPPASPSRTPPPNGSLTMVDEKGRSLPSVSSFGGVLGRSSSPTLHKGLPSSLSNGSSGAVKMTPDDDDSSGSVSR